jgi:hypothetical protein
MLSMSLFQFFINYLHADAYFTLYIIRVDDELLLRNQASAISKGTKTIAAILLEQAAEKKNDVETLSSSIKSHSSCSSSEDEEDSSTRKSSRKRKQTEKAKEAAEMVTDSKAKAAAMDQKTQSKAAKKKAVLKDRTQLALNVLEKLVSETKQPEKALVLSDKENGENRNPSMLDEECEVIVILQTAIRPSYSRWRTIIVLFLSG